MDDVSLLTPSLPERETRLLRALRSVAGQHRPPTEHLIRVDHERIGAGRTRNVLLEAASSPIVAFLDDDDELLPNHLAVLVDALVFFDADVVYSLPSSLGKVPAGVGGAFDFDRLRARNFIPVTVVAKRDVLLDVGGFPDVHAEDWALWLLLGQFGADFVHVPLETWIYHRSPDGKQSNRPRGARQEALAVLNRSAP